MQVGKALEKKKDEEKLGDEAMGVGSSAFINLSLGEPCVDSD